MNTRSLMLAGALHEWLDEHARTTRRTRTHAPNSIEMDHQCDMERDGAAER